MEQGELLRRTIRSLDRLSIPYMLVGSLASSLYGEPRYTADIDIVVDLRLDQVVPLCREFPPEQFYVSQVAAEEAVRSRKQFNVIHPESGNKIDFLLPRLDAWGRMQFQRRRSQQILPGETGYLAAPEDVILSKMRYYDEGQSDKHLRDITGMLRTLGDGVDYSYIEHWAAELNVIHVWRAIQARLQMDEGSATDDVPF